MQESAQIVQKSAKALGNVELRAPRFECLLLEDSHCELQKSLYQDPGERGWPQRGQAVFNQIPVKSG